MRNTRAFPRHINEASDWSARTRAQPDGLKFGSTEQPTLVATHVKSSFRGADVEEAVHLVQVYRRHRATTDPLAVRCFGALVMHDVIDARRFTARLNQLVSKMLPALLRDATAPI